MTYKLLIYYTICFFLILVITKISYKLNLVDKPSKRSSHLKPTSYIGGIAISIALVISIFIFNITDQKLNLILSTAFLVSLVGFIDDKFSLSVGNKLSLITIPIIYLIVFQEFSLKHLGDYDLFKLNLGAFNVPFTLISILFLTNSINYFDGLDGTLSFLIICSLLILYLITSDTNLHKFILIFVSTICFFLIFNLNVFNLPKVFLGDSGSLQIGFIVSFLLIYIAINNLIHPIIIAWSIVILVYEFLAINLIRIMKNIKIFDPAKDHLHHIFFIKTKSLVLTNFLICLLNIFLFLIGYLSFLFINPITSLVFYILLFCIFLLCRYKYYKREL